MRFRDEDAVSPVIGVILMVAITVVLAATVFLLVSRLGNTEAEDPVDMSFSTDENDNSATIISVQGQPDWSRFAITCDGTPIAPAPSGAVQAGERFQCAGGERMVVRNVETNTLLLEYRFQ